jgi:hypothetical protein
MATKHSNTINGTYGKPMMEMRDLAAKLRGATHHFLDDPYALTALEEAIDALTGSANQMRTAYNRKLERDAAEAK